MKSQGLLFPDDIFNIKNPDLHKEMVEKGYEIASNTNILFCGIARDVGSKLERNLLRIEETGKCFRDHRAFIYENDSEDNTADILDKYCGEHLYYVSDTRRDKDYLSLLLNGEDKVHFNRCKVLADCRNVYLDYAKENKYLFDYVCVLDLDTWGGWSYQGFFHSLAVLEDQERNGAVTAYGVLSDFNNSKPLEVVDPSLYLMYDSFVFRPLGAEQVKKRDTARYNGIVMSPGEDPVMVNSNFGGMGIYKTKAIVPEKYGVTLWDEESVDPDHVVLHRGMGNRGWNIIFNPSMLLSYSNHKYSELPL